MLDQQWIFLRLQLFYSSCMQALLLSTKPTLLRIRTTVSCALTSTKRSGLHTLNTNLPKNFSARASRTSWIAYWLKTLNRDWRSRKLNKMNGIMDPLSLLSNCSMNLTKEERKSSKNSKKPEFKKLWKSKSSNSSNKEIWVWLIIIIIILLFLDFYDIITIILIIKNNNFLFNNINISVQWQRFQIWRNCCQGICRNWKEVQIRIKEDA